jgi:hypothetical protein
MEAIAERMAARNFYAGKVADLVDHKPGDAQLLPIRIRDLPKELTKEELELAQYTQANAMNLVTGVSDEIRGSMKKMLIDHRQRRAPTSELQQNLFDSYADMNADLRRIAVTETAGSALSSLVSSYNPGSKVKWFAWPNACKYCEAMNGRVITVVSPGDKRGVTEWQNTIYAGKTNYGRSFAGRKITAEGMVPREEDELAGPACPAHPHCRCTLVDVVEEGAPPPEQTNRQGMADKLAQARAI